jgi:plasmid stabilization system protein ParE
MNVVYAPRALHDLQGIVTYLTEQSPSAASHVLAALKSSIATLSYFPEIGRIVDDAGHRGCRSHAIPIPYFIVLWTTNFSYCTYGTRRDGQSIL